MASKKDRGKGKIVNTSDNKSLAIKPESSPIGTPAASPITTSLALTNRFMTFSPEPNITFSSALATEFSPFLGPSIRPRMPFIKAEKPSAYVRLSYFQHLFFVEIGMAPIKDPSQLAIAYFPPRFHWVPEHPLKDISYYTTILVETKSVHFKPILDQKTGKTLYMSVYFDKVLLLKDWGEHPSQPRVLSNSELSYSYYDYIDAWFRFMLYQNSTNNHSWFINFDKKFSGILPLWFSKWWGQFGAIPDILPLQLAKAFGTFRDYYNTDAYGKKFPAIMHFVIKFKISWILKWNYVKNGDIIDRHWFVKWWDKYPQTDAIVQTVYKDFAKKTPEKGLPAIPVAVPKPTELVTPSHFLSPPEEKKATDKLSDDKSAASSSSTKDKKKKKGPSKNDMRMFQQFLKSYKEENNIGDSEDSGEENSSEISLDTAGLGGADRHLFGHDPFTTQDALDALEAIPGIEDIPDLDY